jgi:hypothetical protein
VSGALLLELAGESSFDLFGSAVAGLEDLDGDGRGDLVVGASLSDAKGSGAGSAYVYSGATGALLWTLRGEASGDAFGYAVADAGDVNGDGASDVLVGAPGADAGGQNSAAMRTARARVRSASSRGSMAHSSASCAGRALVHASAQRWRVLATSTTMA